MMRVGKKIRKAFKDNQDNSKVRDSEEKKKIRENKRNTAIVFFNNLYCLMMYRIILSSDYILIPNTDGGLNQLEDVLRIDVKLYNNDQSIIV